MTQISIFHINGLNVKIIIKVHLIDRNPKCSNNFDDYLYDRVSELLHWFVPPEAEMMDSIFLIGVL